MKLEEGGSETGSEESECEDDDEFDDEVPWEEGHDEYFIDSLD